MIALPLFVLLCCLAVSEADGVGAEKQVQELYRAGSQYFQAKKYNEAKEVWAYLLQIIPQFQVVSQLIELRLQTESIRINYNVNSTFRCWYW